MNLYLPIEILSREFQSKLLIGMESASRGINVYIGRLTPYLLRDFFVPGIILLKSITPSNTRIEQLNFYKNKKFIITCLDEEVGLFKLDGVDYTKLRFSNKSIDLVDKIFTWGNFDFNNLSKRYPKYKTKFVISGNPRLDFWTKNFNSYYKNKKFRYKDFILFSLNISLMMPPRKFKKYLKFLDKSDYMKRGYTIKNIIKIRNNSQKMLKKFLEIISQLAKKTNFQIIVRPHPTESMEYYNSLKRLKNVKVIKEGNLSEWIYNSKVVVHLGCTGGLEASARGKPTISYSPYENMKHGHSYANSFSIKAKNFKEILHIVRKIENQNIEIKKPNLKKLKFHAHNFSSKKPSYKIITDELIKITKNKNINNENNDLLLKLKFRLRDLRSKMLNYKYGNTKFSFFDKSEVIKIFEDFKNLDPKYNQLKLIFMKKDIIQIKN